MITDGNFSAFLKELQMEWKEELNTSPEVKKAKLDLDYHRKKIRQMTEELNNAEHFEKELIVKEKKIEERIKPVLMRFYEGLEPPLSISRPLLQDTVQTQPWEKVVSLTKRRVEMLESTDRQDLISLMWIILQLRDEYAEKLNKDAVEYLQ
ncbi:uncharacterized protein LOC111715920, partial [Eurytemora carolleeae]|uniref:uncharacterized protein LOC111715920 n=1 Tax=Eurytemora carolleeae TaxID=1294199 RepID=UPI000C77EA91